MKYFDIYQHPALGIEVVKRGFSWPAFIFIWIWAMIKKLWIHGSVALVLLLVLPAMIIPNDIHYHQPTRLSEYLIMQIPIILLAVAYGIYGNGWRRKNLESRGYEKVGEEPAQSPEQALAYHERKKNQGGR